MKKLKDLLKESNVWDRKFGEPLPTLADTTARHAAKQNQVNEDELNEGGKELDQSYIRHAAAMTDRNNHTEARTTLARGVKNKKLEMAYKNLLKVHEFLGRANETNVARAALDKILSKQLKQKFSNWEEAEGAL